MRKILAVAIALSFVKMTHGQEMPSVFNKALSENDNQLKKIEQRSNGELIVIGGGASKSYFGKLSSDGQIIFEKKNEKNQDIFYNDMVVTENGSVLVVGGGTRANGSGRITLFDNNGIVVFDKIFEKNSGGYFNKVKQDNAGNFIAVGVDGSSPCKSRITKINNKGDILFDNTYKENTILNDLAIDDEDNIIGIGGDTGDSKGLGLLLKLNSSGNKVYEINSGNGGYSYTDGFFMEDGSFLAIGGGIYGTGNPCRATRVMYDGQIIFDKAYSLVDGLFSSIAVDQQGNIVLSAEEFDRGRVIKIRPDGTIIFDRETTSPIVGAKINYSNQIIAIGSKDGSSQLVKLSSDGKQIFDVPLPHVSLKKLLLSEDGKIYATSEKSCRILKFDDTNGELIFDKEYGKVNSEATYLAIKNLPSGEIVAIGGGKGDGNRITKISHSASINDITVSEPISGVSIARVSVSLTGFLLENGIRKPVTISYKSLFNDIVNNGDITQIEGVLSFIPSDFSQGEAIVKTIELPIKSDQILEGTEKVSIELYNAKNTYISKEIGIVTIEEQEAIIRHLSGSDVIEGEPLKYTVGIFKQDGSVLKNKTGFPIKISYKFGFGSAVPNIDFYASTKKQLLINDGESTGAIHVKTIENSFYKDAESVQVVLFDVTCSKDALISFLGRAKTLSNTQYIKDIGAEVQISKISDHNRSGENASSMFKISLKKVSDGSTVTNCSGGDIQVRFNVDSSSTAVVNKDFVIVSGNHVSIVGGCGGREADIKVVCIPDNKKNINTSIALYIDSIKWPLSAGPLSISSNRKAMATLLGK